MRLLRSPKTSNRWNETDKQSLGAYSQDWNPGDVIPLDGTLEKYGSRHTEIGVELDEHDILQLHEGLIKYYRRCQRDMNRLEKRSEELESAFRKVAYLISARSPAPSTAEMLEAVKEIADHYGDRRNRDARFRASFRWVRWNRL